MSNLNEKYCSCLYYSASALSRNMTRLADEAFRTTGLAPSYGFILMTINDEPGLNAKDISQIMQLEPSTVTRLLEKLESKNYLERKKVGRNIEVYPLQASLKLNSKLKKAWAKLFNEYNSILGEKKAKKLTDKIHDANKSLSK